MDGANNAAKVPVSFWVVAGLGFLWNCFGAYLYTMAKLNPQTMMADAPPPVQDYVAHMPLWAHLGWSFGVWASFVGSVLMLVRSRHAVTAFLVSGIGALASFAAQGMAGVLEPAQPVVILAVIVFLWWYSRHSVAQGILR